MYWSGTCVRKYFRQFVVSFKEFKKYVEEDVNKLTQQLVKSD